MIFSFKIIKYPIPLGKTTLIIQSNVDDIIIEKEFSGVLLNTNSAMAALMAGSITLIIGIILVSIKYPAMPATEVKNGMLAENEL